MTSYLSATSPSSRIKKRRPAVIAAFCVGWLVCAIGLTITAFDGFIFLIFLPFTSAIISGLFVGLALLVGLVLRIPIVARLWNGTSLWAIIVAGLSLFGLAFGLFLAITQDGRAPESGGEIHSFTRLWLIGGYLLLLVAVTHWPIEQKRAS